MWPFRPFETPYEPPPTVRDPHDTLLDLIEQVAQLRATVRGMETEWDSVRDQIRKGYQRMERSNQRFERRTHVEEGDLDAEASGPVDGHPEGTRDIPPLHGSFAEKLSQLREGKAG